MKLINMTVYVLEQSKRYFDGHIVLSQYEELTRSYANFLKQPLALWMFVPCDHEGHVLTDPCTHNSNCIDFCQGSCSQEYYEAQEKCLFEGWKLKDPKKNLGFKIVWDDDFEINLDTLSCGQYVEGGYLDGRLLGNTIGQLADTFKGIRLTETALKTL